jgi:uncharacterized protein YidB (DUF937 family)
MCTCQCKVADRSILAIGVATLWTQEYIRPFLSGRARRRRHKQDHYRCGAHRIDKQGEIVGMFDGILGGVVGAEMATVVNGLIEKHGGVQGIVSQMESQGLGNTVKSWIGTGANEPITADQVHAALGSDLVNQMASKMGIDPGELSSKLAQVLPGAIDKLTPGGVVPPAS